MIYCELEPPLQDTDCGRWFVRTIEDQMKFLDRAGQIAMPNFGSSNDMLYFTSEDDAHMAACAYYAVRLQAYPYMNEWNACSAPETVKTQSNESQIMVFE